MEKEYEKWEGEKVFRDGEFFIETKKADWDHRLWYWKSRYLFDNLVPCPMPYGHVMFRNTKRKKNDYS